MSKYEPEYTREKVNNNVTANPLLRGFILIATQRSQKLFLEPVHLKKSSAPKKRQNALNGTW